MVTDTSKTAQTQQQFTSAIAIRRVIPHQRTLNSPSHPSKHSPTLDASLTLISFFFAKSDLKDFTNFNRVRLEIDTIYVVEAFFSSVGAANERFR